MCVGDGWRCVCGDDGNTLRRSKRCSSSSEAGQRAANLPSAVFFGGGYYYGSEWGFRSRVGEVACQQSIHEQVRESSRGALHAGACVEERGGGGGGGSKAAQGGGAWLVCLGELWVASETGLVNEI